MRVTATNCNYISPMLFRIETVCREEEGGGCWRGKALLDARTYIANPLTCTNSRNYNRMCDRIMQSRSLERARVSGMFHSAAVYRRRTHDKEMVLLWIYSASATMSNHSPRETSLGSLSDYVESTWSNCPVVVTRCKSSALSRDSRRARGIYTCIWRSSPGRSI